MAVAEVVLRTTLTYKEYCIILDDGKRHELLEGQHHVTPAPGTRHQRVLTRLFTALRGYFDEGERGEVFLSPTDVILTDRDVVQPDLVAVTVPEQISERGIEGPPALMIEILSPSTAEYDRTVKAQRYATLGVPHFWIVDPAARTLECYRLKEGRYVLSLSGHDQDALTLPEFPSLTVPLANLWPK